VTLGPLMADADGDTQHRSPVTGHRDEPLLHVAAIRTYKAVAPAPTTAQLTYRPCPATNPCATLGTAATAIGRQHGPEFASMTPGTGQYDTRHWTVHRTTKSLRTLAANTSPFDGLCFGP